VSRTHRQQRHIAGAERRPDVDVFAKGMRNALEKLARSVETAA
jgi:hypothetical protein